MKHAKRNETNQTKNKEQALESMTHTPETKQTTETAPESGQKSSITGKLQSIHCKFVP